MAQPLSQEESALTLDLTGFYWLNLHRNTGRVWKAHRSLSGSNDQTIDNIQRTMRAYLEAGPDCERTIKLWGNKLISCLDPYHLN